MDNSWCNGDMVRLLFGAQLRKAWRKYYSVLMTEILIWAH